MYATLPAYDELRRQIGDLCRASLPRALRRRRRRRPRRRYPLAIDLHQVHYFKRQQLPPAHVRKGKYQPGTAYSHDYATASLLRKGQYYVVAMTPYDPDDNKAELACVCVDPRYENQGLGGKLMQYAEAQA